MNKIRIVAFETKKRTLLIKGKREQMRSVSEVAKWSKGGGALAHNHFHVEALFINLENANLFGTGRIKPMEVPAEHTNLGFIGIELYCKAYDRKPNVKDKVQRKMFSNF